MRQCPKCNNFVSEYSCPRCEGLGPADVRRVVLATIAELFAIDGPPDDETDVKNVEQLVKQVQDKISRELPSVDDQPKTTQFVATNGNETHLFSHPRRLATFLWGKVKREWLVGAIKPCEGDAAELMRQLMRSQRQLHSCTTTDPESGHGGK